MWTVCSWIKLEVPPASFWSWTCTHLAIAIGQVVITNTSATHPVLHATRQQLYHCAMFFHWGRHSRLLVVASKSRNNLEARKKNAHMFFKTWEEDPSVSHQLASRTVLKVSCFTSLLLGKVMQPAQETVARGGRCHVNVCVCVLVRAPKWTC